MGAQRTRLGDRLQGGIALSHRFGGEEPPEHHHDAGSEPHHHDAAPRSASWDAFVELAGEWEGRQTIAGEVEAQSGGAWAWVAPGVRYNAASGGARPPQSRCRCGRTSVLRTPTIASG